MFDLGKDFRSILPKLTDQTLQYVHDDLNTHHSHSVKKILHDIEMERKGQILRPTPNTAPLICGACYNTQPEDLLTMA